MRRQAVLILVVCTGLSACGDVVSLSVNVTGTYVAVGTEPHFVDYWLVFPDSTGALTDTIAHHYVTDMQFEFFDNELNPDAWDDARLEVIMVCESFSTWYSCEEDSTGSLLTMRQSHRYTATVDTLTLRSHDFGPEAWAVVPWIGERAGFEVLFPRAYPDVIRFERQGRS